MIRILTTTLFLTLFVSIHPLIVQAETSYSFELFWGTQFNIPTPLTIKQRGEETIKGGWAKYESDAWTWFNSPYYAWRISLWKNDRAWELELVHEKIILKNKPEDVQHFEISHGYNLITINRAWRLSEYYDLIWRLGAGIVLTHPETTVRNKEKGYGEDFPKGFYISGPTAQIALGKRFNLWGKGLFGVLEAKFTASYATQCPLPMDMRKCQTLLYTVFLGWDMNLDQKDKA